MRALVVSDIHGNLEALKAVLADAGPFDMLWCLGDLVGYGPEPNACIQVVRSFRHLSIPGNHDWGVLGRLDLNDFNIDARQANLWTRSQLTADARQYLEGLPEMRVEADITLAHGSPRYPIWEYLLYPSTAALNMAHFDTRLCLVGHTHVPIRYSNEGEAVDVEMHALEERRPLVLEQGRHILNPGSVGQPRDGDPRAAYMLLDTETLNVEHRRIAYPVSRTQERMRELRLPERLISRLEVGW
ncbi:MAG: metallophosphoesterase family protein [Anaerolineae bacterium]|nr:metallophosphoesterase family protein [Chloroflexota bacterium]